MNPRDRILEAAAGIFVVNGYRSSRMTAIARAAGVSRQTLYNHFPSKEAILIGLHERVISDAREFGLPLLKADKPAGERIAAWLRHSLQSQWRHHAVRVVTIEETQGVLLAESAATDAIVTTVARTLRATISEGIRAGEFRADLKPAATAYSIQSMLLGLHRNNVSQRPLLEIRTGDAVDTAVDIIVGGLRRHADMNVTAPARIR